MGQVHGSQANGAFVFNHCQGEISFFEVPSVQSKDFVADGVVSQYELICRHEKGPDILPPCDGMKDPENTFAQVELPQATFWGVIRATPAGDGRLLFGFNLRVRAIDRCGTVRSEGKGVRIGC